MFGFNRQRDPNRPRLSFGQRVIGMGANMLLPGLGMGTNTLFNMRNAARDVISSAGTTSYGIGGFGGGSPNLGLSPAQSQSPQAPVVQTPSADIPLMGGAGNYLQPNAPIQPNSPNQQNSPNTQQQISQMPAAMQRWIAQNGLPQTQEQIRQATNAMYLDQATGMANSNYGQDIGFVAPQARAPRQF